MLLILLTLAPVKQAGLEHIQGLLLVPVLGALILALRHKAGGQMGDPDGGIGGIHALPARPGRAEDIHTDFRSGNLNVIHLIHFREDGHGCRRSMDAPRGFRHGHTLDPMASGFILEDAVDMGPCDRENDFLESPDIRGAHINDGHFPAARIAEPGIEPEKIPGKKGGLIPACTRADFHDDVPFVIRIRGEQGA